MRGYVLALGLATAGLTFALSRPPGPDEAARNRVISSVDDIWQQALYLGVNPNRFPRVTFEPLGDDRIAVTRCDTQPVLAFNAAYVDGRRDEWVLLTFAVPHELAHALVCIDGDVTGWREQHGAAWADWVRRLVPREQADDIIELEAP